jgi:hypothetical protein
VHFQFLGHMNHIVITKFLNVPSYALDLGELYTTLHINLY